MVQCAAGSSKSGGNKNCGRKEVAEIVVGVVERTAIKISGLLGHWIGHGLGVTDR